MPRLRRAIPKYRKHRPSGQAVVTLDSRDFYLGPYGSTTSRLEYDRLIGEWIQNGRRLPHHSEEVVGASIIELIASYWKFAEGHYRKHGEPTMELVNIRYALRPLKKLYGHTAVRDFGPLALKSLQREMIQDGLSRKVINSRIGIIKRVIRWAVSEQLAPPSLHHSLTSVSGLQAGRTDARETEPVHPVSDDIIEVTLRVLTLATKPQIR